jgi:hypothetical protein
MSDYADLIDRYIAVWNETDAARRGDLIARTWTENASYVDPLVRADGYDGLNAVVQGVQEQFPGYRFRRVGNSDAHNERVRFSWELAPEDGKPFARGTDFGVVVNGRFETVTGFLDEIAAA